MPGHRLNEPQEKADSSSRERGPKRTWRWKKWGLIGGPVLLLVLLPVVAIRALSWPGRSYAARRVQEEAAWWNSQWPDVPDDTNRYFAYQEVVKQLQETDLTFGREWWRNRLTRLPKMGDGWPEDDDAILEAVASRSGLLNTLEDAIGLPEYRLPASFLDFGEDYSITRRFHPTDGPADMVRLHLGEMLAYRAWIDLREGRRRDGSKRLVELLRYSVDMCRGTSLDSLFHGIMTMERVPMVVSDTVNLPSWTADELRALADQLSCELVRQPRFGDTMRAERFRTLLFVAHGELALQGGNPSILAKLVWPVLQAFSVKRYDDFMERVIQAQSLPESKFRAETDKFSEELTTLVREDRENFMTVVFVPNVLMSRLALELRSAAVSVAIASLRMRAAYLENGEYPVSMETLSEVDGRAAIMGPFGKGPLRVNVREDGTVVVYCIGRDGIDDGGRSWDIESARKDPPRKPEPKPAARKPQSTMEAVHELCERARKHRKTHKPDDFGIELYKDESSPRDP